MTHTLSYLLHTLVVTSAFLINTIDAADPTFLVPIASTAPRSVSEDEAPATSILTLEGQDTDGDPLTFSIDTQDPTSPPFELESVSGLLKVPSGLDAEVSMSYKFVFGVRDGSTTTYSVPYYVNIVDVNDNAPIFISTPYDITLSESVPIGTNVTRVTATDADVTPVFNTITYSIVSGNSPASFALDQNTGQITVSAALDAITYPSFSLIIQASDGTFTAVTSATVTITVTVDYCKDGPCQNGGNCTNMDNGYNCSCTEGYLGQNCSQGELYSNTMPYTTAPSTTIRLVNGPDRYSGRVEVWYNGQWGTVCDDNFDHNDVKVICRMLGMNFGDSYGAGYSEAYFGVGSGPIVVDDLACRGNENVLQNCRSNTWGTHDCGHTEDAGVDCRAQAGQFYSNTSTSQAQTATATPSTTIRLVNGPDGYSGRVEVWYNGQWGTVCDDDFDHNDVKVICRMLGMNYGDSYGVGYPNAYFGQGNGSIVVDDLACRGNENVLQDCRSSPWGTNNCGHGEDAGVDCRAQAGMFYNSTSSSQGGHTTRMYTNYRLTSRYPYWITSSQRYRLEDAITVSCSENGWDVRVNMNILRYIYPNSLASDIYMGDNTCTGVDRGYEVVFQQGLRQCLTNEAANGPNLVYRNQLVYAEHDRLNPYIIRNFNWTVDIECDVNRNETASGEFHHDLSPSNGHHVSGSSHYAVNMSFYSDPNFINQIQGNPLHVQVGQSVYAKVYSTVSDWTIKMRVHTCYMKPTPTSGSHLNFYIIKDGCEIDSNTHIISQSTHETRLVFQDFQFTNNRDGFYMYCHATFCDTSDYSRTCTQACNPNARRRSGVVNGDGGGGADVDGVSDTTVQPGVSDTTVQP